MRTARALNGAEFDIFRASETAASTHVATSRDEGLQPDWDPVRGCGDQITIGRFAISVNTPPPKGGGFRLRLEAGLIDPSGR